jgi:membrane-bound lytic murein transglycosylase B
MMFPCMIKSTQLAGRTAVVGIAIVRALGLTLAPTVATIAAQAQVVPPAPVVSPSAESAPPLASAAEITAFLERLWPDAKTLGVTRPTFDLAFAGFAPDPDVMTLNASQPEHVKSAGDYAALLVSATRIANGQAQLTAIAPALATLEARFGVDRHILLAIWGMESAYGASMGERKVIRSLTTLALSDARRGEFWRGELMAALMILERRDVVPEQLVGSWAGAMGHTQFIPSTYTAYAVDVDGDGRRDIWGTVADGLGSTANYLRASGWKSDLPWGFEVILPGGFDYASSAPNIWKSTAEWQAVGVVFTKPEHAATPGQLQLILPAGAAGPTILVTRNFSAILRYNRSVSYALSVGHLADRIKGGPVFIRGWPEDDKALSRPEREALQRGLQAQGHDVGEIDGVLGSRTRQAIRAFQRAKGLVEDGHPNAALLLKLQEGVAP